MQITRLFDRKFVPIIAAAAISFGAGYISTAFSAPTAERFDFKVRNDFFAGFAGDKEALDRAMKASEEALAADPKNAPALVWHGAGVYFQSGQAFRAGDSAHGIELYTKGLKEMDDAVAMDPRNVGVLIPRSAVLLTSSETMPPDRARPLVEKAVHGYEATLEIQKDYFDTLGTHPRGELLQGLARGYDRLGNREKAQAYYQRIQNELASTPYAKRAALWMETKSLPREQTGCVGCHVK